MRFLHRIKTSGLARDTGQLALGQSLRLIIQAVYFVLIARSLGPEKYGAFVAVVALAAILTPFSGLGTNNLFIKNVRAGLRTAAACWGNGLAATVVSGIAFSCLVLVINSLFHLRMPLYVVGSVCISDLFLLRVIELASFGFAAVDRMKESAIQTVISSLPRLLAIGFLALWFHPVTLRQWAAGYTLATLVSTMYACYCANRIWGSPRFNWAALRADVTQGVYFSIGASAATVYNDIDKVMLGKVSFAAAGVYAAAYRLIDVSMTPIRALTSAAYPHFFQKGLGGMRSTHAYAKTHIKRSVLYTSVLAVAFWFFAPLLPIVLGPSYVETALTLRWLCVLPFLRGIHAFLGDSLSGAGFQGLRSAIQVAVALINVGLNLLVLPKYGWLGATWTSLASDGLLLITLWLAIQFKLRAAVSSKIHQTLGSTYADSSQHA